MNETKYYCDKCKKCVEKKELNTIALFHGDARGYISESQTHLILDLCDKCASRVGLIKQVIKDDTISKESTTADKLYDIMSQLVAENTNQ